MKLRVGLVGLGGAGRRGIGPLCALSDRFEVRAVCDQIALRAEHAAKEWNARPVDGFRALARQSDVDAILMLAPQWYGCLPILAACDSGKSIYCANTLEMDLTQAQLVRQRVERAGVAFMTELPRRQAAATLRLKELIVTRLGQPRLLFCHLRVPAEQPPQAGRTSNGTAITDLVELVDWCRYVVGKEPTSVLGIAPSLGQRRVRRRLPDDEPRFFGRFARPRHGSDGPDQLRALHAFGLAGSRGLSPAGRTASGLRARHRLHRHAGDARLVRQGGPAPGIARKRAAGRRAVAEPVLSFGHQPRAQHGRTGRCLSGAGRCDRARRSHAEDRRLPLEF